MKRAAWALLLCLPAVPAAAQQDRPLTEEDAAVIAAFYNRPATIRLTGASRVPAGTEVAGDVASMGGPLVVSGTIRGDVLVVNGDLQVEPGGRVTGEVTVTGGAVRGGERVGGRVVVYPEALRFRQEGDRMIALGPSRESWVSAGLPIPFGRAEFVVAGGGAYNRVEGLPVTFGPRLELGRSNPTIVDARLIYRTRSGLRVHPDELGHDARIEQYIGGHRAMKVGVRLFDVVDPIETSGLSNTENSLATFIMHRDYRDHYSRHGWSAYLEYGLRTRPVGLGLEYRDEVHGSVKPQTPWSLLENDQPWRAQPQVAEGVLQSLRGWLRWDTRNDRSDPASGWLVSLAMEQGLEGDLTLRTSVPEEDIADAGGEVPADIELPTRRVGAEFTTLELDVRRYLRMGPRTRVALRGMVAGSPDDGALPPQRQHMLGGEGSLPGYERRRFDCGARTDTLLDGYFPHYGCDRAILFQVEARFAILEGSGFSLGRRLGLDFEVVTTPELVVFADAGRAWIEDESLRDGLLSGPGTLRYDIGVGLRLGRLGFYLAAPLSDDGDRPNLFVRLGPRL